MAPAPDDYLAKVMAELNKFDLEHVMPMHCSGQNFIDLAVRPPAPFWLRHTWSVMAHGVG